MSIHGNNKKKYKKLQRKIKKKKSNTTKINYVDSANGAKSELGKILKQKKFTAMPRETKIIVGEKLTNEEMIEFI